MRRRARRGAQRRLQRLTRRPGPSGKRTARLHDSMYRQGHTAGLLCSWASMDWKPRENVVVSDAPELDHNSVSADEPLKIQEPVHARTCRVRAQRGELEERRVRFAQGGPQLTSRLHVGPLRSACMASHTLMR